MQIFLPLTYCIKNLQFSEISRWFQCWLSDHYGPGSGRTFNWVCCKLVVPKPTFTLDTSEKLQKIETHRSHLRTTESSACKCVFKISSWWFPYVIRIENYYFKRRHSSYYIIKMIRDTSNVLGVSGVILSCSVATLTTLNIPASVLSALELSYLTPEPCSIGRKWETRLAVYCR